MTSCIPMRREFPIFSCLDFPRPGGENSAILRANDADLRVKPLAVLGSLTSNRTCPLAIPKE
jgi:hypothetical protein